MAQLVPPDILLALSSQQRLPSIKPSSQRGWRWRRRESPAAVPVLLSSPQCLRRRTPAPFRYRVARAAAAAAAASFSRVAGMQIELPQELLCQPVASSITAWSGSDIQQIIRGLIAWAIPEKSDGVDNAVASAEQCGLGGFAALTSMGDEDGLLFGIARTPGLIFLADLGRLAGWPQDFALDPWLREHCRLRFPSAWCDDGSIGGKGTFDEAIAARSPSWASKLFSFYKGLQPRIASTLHGSCVGKLETLHVAVVGSHSGLSVAASDAFVGALRSGGQAVRLSFFGHWAWCQNVGNCDEPLAGIFKEYQQDWAETDPAVNSENFRQMFSKFQEFLQSGSALLSADLVLCTRPFLFCWLLREHWPSKESRAPYRGVPILHYYSGPLLFDVPEEAKASVLQAFRRMVIESPLDIVVSSSALQSAWMMAMAGVAVPHVRPHAASLRGLYTPPATMPATLRAIVLRSTWISTLMGEVFRSLLPTLLRASGFDEQLQVTWLKGDMFLEYKEIADFHAAIFFPEQPDKLTFWEQYEMNMPLWLPSADFWIRIHAIGEFRYSVFAKRWAEELPEGATAAVACGLVEPLFFRARSLEDLPLDSPGTVAFWFHLTDYALFPHLQLFSSAAELAKLLLSADLAKTSREMAAFNRRTWRRSSAFYRSAFCKLAGARAGSGGDFTNGLSYGDESSGGRGSPSDAIGDGNTQLPLTQHFLPQPTSPEAWGCTCGETCDGSASSEAAA
eukprot:TRINITY_DN55388_c0_g1_i1.p1 TRINITY_DN55388_c0_g1~~TRINITY_DN55388_c0_g1_i1.p1  ORF type:complete len:734 (-),score=114.61 TRINITY_DN55388_c0_g1_i1:32-2233(-)